MRARRPAVYSTCYRRNPGRAFDGPGCGEACYGAGGAPPPPPWRFEERCVSCDDAAANALPSAVPHWTLATDCQVCHRDDVGAAPPEPPPPPLVAAVPEPPPPPPPLVAAPPPPPPPPPMAFGLSGCSDGSWCCVVIYKGAQGEACAPVRWIPPHPLHPPLRPPPPPTPPPPPSPPPSSSPPPPPPTPSPSSPPPSLPPPPARCRSGTSRAGRTPADPSCRRRACAAACATAGSPRAHTARWGPTRMRVRR